MNFFFTNYVYNTQRVPFDSITNDFGLLLEDNFADDEKIYVGINLQSGKNTISSVERNSPAWFAGLNVGDEIIAINDVRFTGDMSNGLADVRIDDKVEFLIARGGMIKRFILKATNTPYVSYYLVQTEGISEDKKNILKSWLGDL
jgi:predicted metalloprotease with PDZ domain